MTKLYNKRSELIKRKMLRNNMPSAEIILWSQIKGKKLNGYKFRRQYSVDKYVLDFYCPRLKLAIEVDGDSHFIGDAPQYDLIRQEYIESYGIKFLRFTNQDVYENIEGVVHEILQYLPPLTPP